jgi:hypothetical protein
MKTLHAQIPDLLLQELDELARSQGASVDHLVALALAAQVSAWRIRESIAARAARTDWKHVDEILARVPNIPPIEGDEVAK